MRLEDIRPQAVTTILGGMGREERRKEQEAFPHDLGVQVPVANAAAGGGSSFSVRTSW